MAKRKKGPPLIDDETAHDLSDLLNPPGFGHGYDPAQRAANPVMMAPPSDLPIIPRSEWPARIAERKAQRATGMDLRSRMANGKMHKSLDQNGQGYCWAYSVTSTVMFQRAVANQPYVRLSAHSVGCKVKGFRDEGGWCGLSAKFIRENGVASAKDWPEKSMSRQYDTAAVWANAKANVITEDFVDLTVAVYDQNLSFDQVVSCLLQGVFCAVDFNWWSHSVMALDVVEVESGSYGLQIQNSWTDSWGDQGTGILRGNKAIPDGAVATRVVAGG